MSRTGLSPRLNRHMAEPYLEVHPDDARRLGLEPDGLARVTGQGGAALLRVLVSDRVAPGQPFAPIHWTGETAAQGRIGAVVEGAADPVSGQPALKSGAVAVAPFVPAWFGYAVAARPFRPDCAYWARAAHARGMTAELAGGHIPADWEAAARRLFGLGPGLQAQVYADPSRGRTRLAFIDGGALVAALFVDRAPVAVSRAHVAALLGEPAGPALLSGRPGADRPDPGPTVCACLAVGLNTIAAAIASGACPTVAALGDSLGAGTSCGACRPELAALIARHAPLPKEAAE